jgi:hypothetical protein
VVAANYCLLLSSLSSFEGILSLGIGIEGGKRNGNGEQLAGVHHYHRKLLAGELLEKGLEFLDFLELCGVTGRAVAV